MTMTHTPSKASTLTSLFEPFTAGPAVAFAALALCACEDGARIERLTESAMPAAAEPGATPTEAAPTAYIVGSTLNSPEGWNAYVAVLSELAPQEIDYDTVLEVPGRADVWVWDGKVFIAQADTPVVSRYGVTADLELVEDQGARLSFAATGLASAQFWNAIWLTPEKAYMNNAAGLEYVIWNPSSMQIIGSVAHPSIEERAGYVVRNSSTNRGSVVRDGKVYHTYYWTDENYERYAPDSRIAVYDIATDQLIDVIDAPCPGLDVATVDEAGNLYFSSWTGLPGLSLVLGEPTSCAVKIPAGSDQLDPSWTLSWPDITEGRHGAALRHQGSGHGLVSIFHHERVQYDASSDAFALIGTESWQTWRVDLLARTAIPLEGVAANSGAIYVEPLGDLAYALVPTEDYQSSQIYRVDGDDAQPLFSTRGWATRLFQLR
jgi:hypothetical protein